MMGTPMAVNHDGFLELLDQTDQKHAEAHQRLRTDLRELESRTDDALRLLRDAMATKSQVADMANEPIDVTKLVLTPKIVASIIFVVVGIAGGMWASTSGLRSDLRDMATQLKSDQRVADERALRVSDNYDVIKEALSNNSREMKESIAEIKRRQDMLTLQYNELNDKITRLPAARGR